MPKVSNQVLTVVVPERRAIELRCPHCQSIPPMVGAKFCSECGSPLIWDNISVAEPTPPPAPVDQGNARAEMKDPTAKPSN